MTITASSHAEVVSTNIAEAEKPSTSTQNIEEVASTTPPGTNEITEDINETEETSNTKQTELSSDTGSSVLLMRVPNNLLHRHI